MRGVRNLRVSTKVLRACLQGRENTAWEVSEWALDPTAERVPTAARLQQVRERVLAHARRSKPSAIL